LERVIRGIKEQVKREMETILKKGNNGMFDQYRKKGASMMPFNQQASG
jgi:hypothetical protein